MAALPGPGKRFAGRPRAPREARPRGGAPPTPEDGTPIRMHADGDPILRSRAGTWPGRAAAGAARAGGKTLLRLGAPCAGARGSAVGRTTEDGDLLWMPTTEDGHGY